MIERVAGSSSIVCLYLIKDHPVHLLRVDFVPAADLHQLIDLYVIFLDLQVQRIYLLLHRLVKLLLLLLCCSGRLL